MDGMSIWHWIILFVILVLPNIPSYWVMRRAGISGWWWLLLCVPLVGFVWLYVFAFRGWPRLEALGSRSG